jgi:hypothetical protein
MDSNNTENKQIDNDDILSPITIDSNSKEYVTVENIAKKLGNKDVNNIAVTGPYGSGKSSILRTLEKDNHSYTYLNISLATLSGYDEVNAIVDPSDGNGTGNGGTGVADNDKDKQKDKKKDKKGKNSTEQERTLNRLIEYSILQQIIYKEDANSFPYSGFKRIKYLDPKDLLRYARLTIAFLLLFCIAFEPSFLTIPSFVEVLSFNIYFKFAIDVLCVSSMIYILYRALKLLINKFYNCKINKFNIREGELDLKSNESIFNKYLDEIIYFFQVTSYNVVVIEDLDRFKSSSTVFLKLRELNQILNASSTISTKETNSHIVFIYALRDDVFNNTDRTKFFDYIATVIPIINPSNAGDKLQILLNNRGITNLNNDCEKLGIYIDDMRILLNIVNEFIQYRIRLCDSKLNQAKLLAMIIYKNYFPNDFVELHNRRGDLYKALTEKESYTKEIIKKYQNDIHELEEEYKKVQSKYISFSTKDLRSIYVMKYIEHYNENIDIYDKTGTRHKLAEAVNDDSLFEQLISKEMTTYRYNDSLEPFKEIEKKVDPEYTYAQRKDIHGIKLKEITQKIEKTKQQIASINLRPITEILKLYGRDNLIKRFQYDEKRMIPFMLLEGYIDNTYEDYISYFYPGSLTELDRDFVTSARVGETKEYTYHLTKIENVIKKLPIEFYKNGYVLNVDLVDHLSKSPDNYLDQINKLVNFILKNKKSDFVKTYYQNNSNSSLFLKKLLEQWTKFSDVINNSKEEEDKLLFFEILINDFPIDKIETYKSTTLIVLLKKSFSWINSIFLQLNFDNLKSLTEKLELEYENITSSELEYNQTWINYVIDGNHYQISSDNLKTIILYLTPSKEDTFNKATYTAILSTGRQAFIEYANKQIEDFVKCFPSTSVEESQESIIELVNRTNCDTLKKYISRQQQKIEKLDSIDTHKYDVALSLNIITATWSNIAIYMNNEDNGLETDLELLVDYVNKNSSYLSLLQVKQQIDEKEEMKLFNFFILSDTLPLDAYGKIIDSFQMQLIDLDCTFKEERVNILINKHKLAFNETIYSKLNESYPMLLVSYLIENISEFVKNIGEYTLSSEQAFELIKSKIEGKDKMVIISAMPLESITSDNIDAIYKLCRANGTQLLNTDKLISIINTLKNTTDKLNLIIQRCDEKGFDESFVKIALEAIGGNYAIIAEQIGRSPKIPKTKVTERLIEILESNRFTSTHSDKGDQIIVNTRDKR